MSDEKFFVPQELPESMRKVFNREWQVFGNVVKKPVHVVTITHDRLREYNVSRQDGRAIDWGELHELIRFAADELGLFRYKEIEGSYD